MRRLWLLLVLGCCCRALADGPAMDRYGDREATISFYLNTATIEEKLDPYLYQQMMAAARRARRGDASTEEMPFMLFDRDWEVCANLRLLPGDFTFMVEGMGTVTGGFQREIESLARLFSGQMAVSQVPVGGIVGQRFVITPEILAVVSATADEDEDDEEDDEEENLLDDGRVKSLDILLVPLDKGCFQANVGCNVPLPEAEELKLLQPGTENLFLHVDLVFAAYFNVPQLLPLLPDDPDNPQAATLKSFLRQLSGIVVSFAPDNQDLVLRITLEFVDKDQVAAMGTAIAQVVPVFAQSFTMLGKLRDVSCVTQEQNCEISLRISLPEATESLGKIFHQ